MRQTKDSLGWTLIVLCLVLMLAPTSAWAKKDKDKAKKKKEKNAAAAATAEKEASKPSEKESVDAKDKTSEVPTTEKSGETPKPEKPGDGKPAAAPDAKNTGEPPPDTASTATVTQGPVKIEVTTSGNLESTAMTEVTIVPKQWLQLAVAEAVPAGTRVTKGQTLLKLDTTKIDESIRDLESTRALAELSLKQATENYKLLEKSVPLDMESAERTRKQAEQDYELYVKVDAPQAVKSADFMLRSSEQNLEYTTEELKQLEKMYKADDLTEETEEIILKRAKNDVDRAQHMTEQARLRHERTTKVDLPRAAEQQNYTLKQAMLSWERAKLTIPAQHERQKLELEKMHLEHKKAHEKLAELKRDREMMAIVSPADGIVHYGRSQNGKWISATMTAQKFRPGGQVAPHEVLFTIVSEGSWIVRSTVPEKDVAAVKAGMTGRFKLTAYPKNPLQVKVRDVGNVPNSEGMFDMTCEVVAAPNQPLVAGLSGEVRMVTYFSADAISIPNKAVFSDETDEEKKFVYVAGKDRKGEKRNVETGHVKGDMTEIVSGLSAGESVLLQKPAP